MNRVVTWFIVASCAVVCGIAFSMLSPSNIRLPHVSLDREIEVVLDEYFKTWSSGDMERYRLFFLPGAQVALLEGGIVRPISLDNFIADQGAFIKRAIPAAREQAESVLISTHGSVVVVAVKWKIFQGSVYFAGESAFTFTKNTDGQWRIAGLSYFPYPIKPPSPAP